MTRRCSDCGRELPKQRPSENDLLAELYRRLSWICRWCHDLNLLSGDFVPLRLEERWTPEELVSLYRKAADRRAVKQLHWIERKEANRVRREEREMEQGALV